MAADERNAPGRTPRLYMALPAPAADVTAPYYRCLAVLVHLTDTGTGPAKPGTCAWAGAARAVIRSSLRARGDLPGEFFEPLIRAGVYDPHPSRNAQFIRPAVAAFGRRSVQAALLGFLRNGTNPERAGAARAWYWTHMPAKDGKRMAEPGPAELAALAGMRTAWHEAALREFVWNEDIDVRRCILPGLTLKRENYPPELHPLVAAAISIARAHPDEYLRHRVEIQAQA